MPIRFIDEQPAEPPKGKIRFLDDMPQPEKSGSDNFSSYGVSMGVVDPIYGVGQLVPRGLSAAAKAIGLDTVSDLYKQSAENIDTGYKQVSKEYESQRQDPKGFDWGRLVGNVASPINWVGTGAVAPTAKIGAKVATGAAIGGGMTAAMPVENTDNYWTEKAQQFGIGLGAGALGTAATSGIGRVLSPKTAPEVTSMLKEGVKLTAGEMAGGAVKRGEDILRSFPVVGSLVKNSQTNSIKSLNEAAINRALSPIGKSLPKGMDVGRGAIAYAEDTLGQAYDNLLPKLTGKIDKPFADAMDSLDDAVKNNFALEDADKALYKNIMDQIVRNRFSKNGTVFGQGVKDIESELGRLIKSFGSDQSASKRNLSGALSEAQDALRDMLQRANPDNAAELKAINKGWANFKRVQRAASSVGSEEGVFTPAQLQSSVRALDKSKDHSAFAKGMALMQDLSEPAKARMAQSIPNSGSVDRAVGLGLIGAGGLGYQYDNPYLLALGGLGAAYTPAGRKMAEMLLTKRPEIVRQAGTAISKYSPYLASPMAIPLAKNSGD